MAIVCIAFTSAGFVQTTFAQIVAATLPSSRSVQIGDTATAFATIINIGSTSVAACGVGLPSGVNAEFAYQRTDPATNQPLGLPDVPVDLGPGESQSFVFAITPRSELPAQHVRLVFQCENGAIASSLPGLNTLLLSASPTRVPDVIGISRTLTNDGVLVVPEDGDFGFFAASTVNVGEGATLEVTSGPSFNLDGAIILCETDSSSGSCLTPPTGRFETTVSTNQTKTFSVFVRSNSLIPLDPANNRINLEFRQLNCTGSDPSPCTDYEIRGSTSAAITTDRPNTWDTNTWGTLLWQ